MLKYLLFFGLFSSVLSHCPHMMGFKADQPSGPSPPGKLPDGDEGWDYDENAAPGIVPKSHFIQSTYVYRSPNALEEGFSERVITVLKRIREKLGKTARLTLENENVECSTQDDHYRCQEFPSTGAWNYFIVEDEKTGAVVYNFERKLNEKNDGTIEMALLDALSRHSPHSLISFASTEAEKEVGYIRALSNHEVLNLAPSTKSSTPIKIEKFGPNELNLLEPALLEVRTGSGLKLDAKNFLVKFQTPAEFDKALEANQYVFVIFWNSNRMVSLHTFNLWLETAESLRKSADSVVLAHVACHENSDFCHGLSTEDFQTIVAYRNGQNIGKTENIGDVEYYQNWIELMTNDGLQRIENSEQLATFKKGIVLGERRKAVTIGIFENEENQDFQHFKIAAEKLAGKYYLGYFFSGKKESTISTYKFGEKQKRTDYNGRFDPATIMQFVSTSSLPNIIDITSGFTTNLLLRQKRPILLAIGEKSAQNTHFQKLATRQEARKALIFAEIREQNTHSKILEQFGVTGDAGKFVILNKDRVFVVDGEVARCPDHFFRILLDRLEGEADNVLSTKDPHPLRFLQKSKIDEIFGFEESIILPDHTLFLDVDPFAPKSLPSAGTGGCPFMQGGAAASLDGNHDEL